MPRLSIPWKRNRRNSTANSDYLNLSKGDANNTSLTRDTSFSFLGRTRSRSSFPLTLNKDTPKVVTNNNVSKPKVAAPPVLKRTSSFKNRRGAAYGSRTGQYGRKNGDDRSINSTESTLTDGSSLRSYELRNQACAEVGNFFGDAALCLLDGFANVLTIIHGDCAESSYEWRDRREYCGDNKRRQRGRSKSRRSKKKPEQYDADCMSKGDTTVSWGMNAFEGEDIDAKMVPENEGVSRDQHEAAVKNKNELVSESFECDSVGIPETKPLNKEKARVQNASEIVDSSFNLFADFDTAEVLEQNETTVAKEVETITVEHAAAQKTTTKSCACCGVSSTQERVVKLKICSR